MEGGREGGQGGKDVGAGGQNGGGGSGGVAPTVITATVRIIREVSATAVKALPVRP